MIEQSHVEDLVDEFPRLWRKYHKPLLYFVKRRLAGVSGAEPQDVVQDVMLKAYRSGDRYDGSRSFKTWLYAIARNHCIDIVRARRRPGGREGEIGVDPDVVGAPSSSQPEEQVASEESRRRIRSAVDSLPDEDREILFLRYFEEMPYAEIADVVGRPEGTVRYRVHQIKSRLRQQLEGEV